MDGIKMENDRRAKMNVEYGQYSMHVEIEDGISKTSFDLSREDVRHWRDQMTKWLGE